MFTLLNIAFAFAGPSRTTYQAKIIKPDGYPLEASTVNFKFTILDPAGSCILYAETYSNVNMGSSAGLVSFSLGSGVRTFPVSGSTFEQVFSNTTASLTCDAGGPATYSPLASDTRRVVMQFHDGGGWQTLPAMTINAVPYAMYANDSLKFSGKDITDFVQVASLPTCTASEAVRFNGVGFSCVAVGGDSVTSGSVITALGYTPADGASLTTITSNVTSVSSTVFSVSSTVTSLSNSVAASFAAMTSSQWMASGTDISYSLGNVGIGTSTPTAALEINAPVSAAFTTQLKVTDGTTGGYFAVTEGSSALPRYLPTFEYSSASVSGFGGAFVGKIPVAYDINVGTAAAIAIDGRTVSNTALTNANLMVVRNNGATVMTVQASGTVGIGTTSPVTKLDVSGGIRIGTENSTCAPSLAGTLRYNSGVVEYCNGTTWAAFGVSGSGILAINGLVSGSQTFTMGTAGAAPNISSTGSVHTFNFPMAGSATTTAGLLSYSDYLTFSNKQAATSAGIATTLGYTPADIVSVTTLSTATATSFTAINSAMAASFSAITSSQWVSSGSVIHYNSGNVGIGTTAPNMKLTIVNDGGIHAKGTVGSGTVLADPGVGAHMIWYPRSGAFRAGQLNSFGTRWNDSNIGTNSVAVNTDTLASGHSSSAFGWQTSATGFGAMALNGFANASGSYATATGQFTTASGMDAFSAGENTIASASNSFTAGHYSTADSFAMMAIGRYNVLSAGNSTVWSAADPVFVIGIGASSGSRANAVTVLKNGNVGIGTTTPTAKLQIAAGTSSTASFKLTSGVLLTSPQSGTMEYDGAGFYLTDGANIRRMIATGSTSGSIDNASIINSTENISMVPVGSVIVSSTTPATSPSTGALVVKGGAGIAGDVHVGGSISGGNTGQINFTGNLGDGSGGMRFSSVGSVDVAIDTDNNDTIRQFRVMTNGSDRASATTLLAVTEAGNVGIGTTTPSASLDVIGNFRVATSVSTTSAIELGNMVYGSLNPGTSTPNGGYIQGPQNASLVVDLRNNQNDDAFAIRYSASNTSVVDTVGMVFTGLGRMGIGTSSPASTLHVSGTIRADENLTITGAGSFLNNGSGVLLLRPASNEFRVQNSTGSSEYLTVKSGSIGIGTSAPATRLHIVDSAANILTLERTNNQNSLIEYKNTLGSIYAGQVNGTTSWGIGSGLDLGATGVFQVTPTGRVYIGGTTAPLARLQITPGTSSVAPIKLGLGVLLTSPQSGTIEYDGSDYYVTDNAGVRRTIATATTGGVLTNTNTVSSTSGITLWPAAGNSVVVSSTVASTNSATGALIVNGGTGIAGNLNVGGAISGSSIIKATGFRANQGAPDAADSSTVGYAFGADGDTGIFSPGSGSANGILSFYSNNAERIRMTASGSLGIGIIPTAPLHVSNTSTQVKLILGKDDNSIAESSLIKIDAAGSSSFTAGIALTSGGNQSVGAAIFRPSGSGGLYFKGQTSFTTMTSATTPDLYISANGHVGVGIANPTYQFTVAKDFTGLTSQTAAFIGGTDTATANTGIYVTQKDNTGLASNNSYLLNAVHNNISKFVVTGAGNVGIGTTTPDKQLTMHSTGVDNYIHLTSSLTGTTALDGVMIGTGSSGDAAFYNRESTNMLFLTSNTERVRIDPTGNVGIGTIGPVAKLDVNDSGTSADLATIQSLPSGANSGFRYAFRAGMEGTSNSDAVAYGARMRATNLAGQYLLYGYRDDNGVSTANIKGNGDAYFAGNVGIGTTNPVHKLSVTGSIAKQTLTGIDGTFDNFLKYGLAADLESGTAFANRWHGIDASITAGAASANKMKFRMYAGTAANSAPFDVMTIQGDGNVGIGTTTPTQKLSVVGDISVTGQVTSRDFFEKTVSIADGWAIGDYVEIVQGAPGAAGGSSTWEVHLGGTRNSWTEGTTYIITGTHSAGSSWREAPHSFENGYVGNSKCFTVDVNGNTNAPQFRIRAIKASASCGVAGTSLPLNFRIRSIGINASWTNLSATGTGATVVGMQSMGMSWNLYTGNPQNNGIPAIHASSAGNVGIGTSAPVAVLHSKNAALVGGNPATSGITDTAILQRIEANTGVLDIGMQSSGAVWLQPRDRTNLASNFNLLLNSNGGNVGIGLTNPTYQLQLSTDSAAKPGTSTWTIASDARLKNIRAPFTRGIAALNGLNTVYFNYKQDNPLGLPSSKEFVGIKAQDVLKVIPEAVSQDDEGYFHVTNDSIIWTAVNAIKELYHKLIGVEVEIKNLKVENANKDRKIQSLEQENAAIKAYLCSKDPAAPICK